jgi:hypothetical protein
MPSAGFEPVIPAIKRQADVRLRPHGPLDLAKQVSLHIITRFMSLRSLYLFVTEGNIILVVDTERNGEV